MNKFRILSVFFLGITVGVTVLLFLGIISRNNFVKLSQAAALPTPPVLCPHCGFGSDLGNRLTGVDLKNAYLTSFSSSGNDFTGTNFKKATLNNASSNSDNFTGAKFINASIVHGQIVDDNFTGADFTGAIMTNWPSSGNNDFTNANFTNADLTGSDFVAGGGNVFTGAIWSNTTCPDGTNSDSDGNTCSGHGTP
ncbi:MAG TPA: pentapeptide repeat-containing protein [Patescibacteria group bacterium]|nr:pentapeptide repeat-containing protein [Patescibacteria group bacterium]